MALEDYIYHASTRGEELEELFYNHSVPMGDFGNGIYLSDDEYKSKIWGASTNNPFPCMNFFDISPSIYDLPGYEIDPNNDYSLLFWITSIAYPRRDRGRLADFREEVERLYATYVEPYINSYHWILSNRSDDGTSYFLPDFFSGVVSIDGVRAVYDDLSFGSQLTLKTLEAQACLSSAGHACYDGTPFFGEYEDWINNNSAQYKASIRNTYTIYPGYHEGVSCYEF